MQGSGIGGPVPPLLNGKLKKKKVDNEISGSKKIILNTSAAKPRLDSQNVSPSSVLAFPRAHHLHQLSHSQAIYAAIGTLTAQMFVSQSKNFGKMNYILKVLGRRDHHSQR